MNLKTVSIPRVHLNGKTSAALIYTVRSTFLVSILFFTLTFMHMFFHEGGHALFNLSKGLPVTLFYAHPFSFVGFIRPMVDYYNVWQHLSGIVVEVLVSILIFIILWKHRSFYTLPFLLVFPWSATYNGIGDVLDILGKSGDYYNIMRITGLTATGFYFQSIILAVVGIFFFISLLPLLDLAPEDKKSLVVLPAGMLIYAAFGVLIAHLVVPGTPVDIQNHLAGEIIASATLRPLLMATIGLLLAVIYITLYRRIYKRLPAWLRVEKANLSWKDLWFPGLLFVVSTLVGLLMIT